MEKNDKKERPYLRIFVRGIFPKPLEEKLVRNWNVLPLRVLDECRKQGVRFVDEHKKGILVERMAKSWITRKGLRLRFPLIMGDMLQEEDSAYSIGLKSDSGTTLLGIADEFSLDDKKARIAFTVESVKFEDIDQFSEYQERLLSDLMLILTAALDVLQRENIEIQLDLVSVLLKMPKDLRMNEELDKKPFITWLRNLFGFPKSAVTSFEISTIDFEWEEDQVERSIAIRKSALQYEIGNINARGEPLAISQRINSLIADGFKILQNMKQIVFTSEA